MTDAQGAKEGVAAPGAAASRVFRTELNPVDFLRRAAYMHPEKIGVADGERPYSYRQLAERSWQLANDLDQLHLGHHRTAEGGAVHLPRRGSKCAEAR